MNGAAMSTFHIDDDNNITAHAAVPADPTNTFSTQKQLVKLTADWPTTRYVKCWNSFAGAVPFDDLKPVKKFTNRSAAIGRIWKAIQRLATDADAPQDAPEAKKATKSPSKGKRRNTARANARQGAKQATKTTREGSKKADVLVLLHRTDGATLAEIIEATGWQKHTVRGFISGTLVRKMGLKIESFRNVDKERVYRIAK